MRTSKRTVALRLGSTDKVWSICGWLIKLCDPLVTHGPYLICITAVLRDSLLYGWAVCLNWNKGRLLISLFLVLQCRFIGHLSVFHVVFCRVVCFFISCLMSNYIDDDDCTFVRDAVVAAAEKRDVCSIPRLQSEQHPGVQLQRQRAIGDQTVLATVRGGFRHVQHVRPNRAPQKGGPHKRTGKFLQHSIMPEITEIIIRRKRFCVARWRHKVLCESLTKCRWWQHCHCACRVNSVRRLY